MHFTAHYHYHFWHYFLWICPQSEELLNPHAGSLL